MSIREPMTLVLLFQSLELFTRKVPGVGWIAGGWLNHNDIYRVIQADGLWLLCRGGRLLQDRR